MGFFADYMDVPDDAYPEVPDHIDPFTGNFKTGTRKCSKCKAYKTKSDYNAEQEKKPASRRICNDCGPPMPKDLNSFTIPQIKEELKKRGVGHDAVKGLKKADLVARLQTVLDGEANVEVKSDDAAATKTDAGEFTKKTSSTVNNSNALTREYILSLKVVDLKKELKARGKPVSGLKAVLQDRLLAEIPSPETQVATTAKETAIVDDKENASEAATNRVQKKVLPPIEDITKKTEALSLCAPSSGPFHWKKTPPLPGAPEVKQNDSGRTFYWCAKCKMWTPSHSTVQHINKKKKKGGNQNKIGGPLAPLHGMPRPLYTAHH